MDTAQYLALFVTYSEHFVTGASILAGFLRWGLPYLQAWSAKTATEADDAAAEAASLAIAFLTILAEGVHKAANAVALNPRPAAKNIDVPDLTEEVVIDVDEDADKSSDGEI